MDTCRHIAAVECVDEATYGLCGFPIKEDKRIIALLIEGELRMILSASMIIGIEVVSYTIGISIYKYRRNIKFFLGNITFSKNLGDGVTEFNFNEITLTPSRDGGCRRCCHHESDTPDKPVPCRFFQIINLIEIRTVR